MLLPHFNPRPIGLPIDTVVIHSMYAPNSPDPYSLTECRSLLDTHKVAPHYIIGRDGNTECVVDESLRAWHAGASAMPDGRVDVNNFSIGIELIGDPQTLFTPEQYDTLVSLVTEIASRHPIRHVIGHDSISPDRKSDPGPLFDWGLLACKLLLRVAGPVEVISTDWSNRKDF